MGYVTYTFKLNAEVIEKSKKSKYLTKSVVDLLSQEQSGVITMKREFKLQNGLYGLYEKTAVCDKPEKQAVTEQEGDKLPGCKCLFKWKLDSVNECKCFLNNVIQWFPFFKRQKIKHMVRDALMVKFKWYKKGLFTKTIDYINGLEWQGACTDSAYTDYVDGIEAPPHGSFSLIMDCKFKDSITGKIVFDI